MARIKKGINGGFQGRIGNIIGYPLRGQDVIKTAPKKRTTPPTEKELVNRAKFKASQVWLQPITDFLRIGFQDYQPTYEGFVAAKSYNSKNALSIDDAGNFYIDPSLALVSFGSLDLADTASVDVSVPGEVTVSWSKNGDYAYNDKAMLLAYAIDSGRADFDTAVGKRQHGKATLQIQPYKGRKFHIYLAFITDDRKNRSNSQYLGEVEVPLA